MRPLYLSIYVLQCACQACAPPDKDSGNVYMEVHLHVHDGAAP